jgi:hypothetical protein
MKFRSPQSQKIPKKVSEKNSEKKFQNKIPKKISIKNTEKKIPERC